MSTSLPRDVQRRVVQLIPGLECAEIARFGYAVEYDYVPSGEVFDTMETRRVEGLFLAGQINGTSGYEEAAAQGLVAGINAAAAILDLPPFVLQRSEAYLGVLVDDLVHMSLTEPYRMFTSRAEFRLMLRVDNADERLMHYAERYGLLDQPLRRVRERNARELAGLEALLGRRVDRRHVDDIVRDTAASPGNGPYTIEKLLRTPGITANDLRGIVPEFGRAHPEVLEKLEVKVRYVGYIKRQERNILSARKLEGWNLPDDLKYEEIFGLSSEAIQKLEELRPRTVAQASRIDGVRAADLSLLCVHLERRRREQPSRSRAN